MRQKVFVTASEVGEYVYCPRGWWLRRNGLMPGTNELMSEGSKKHDGMARNLRINQILAMIAMTIIVLGLVILIILFSYQWIFSTK